MVLGVLFQSVYHDVHSAKAWPVPAVCQHVKSCNNHWEVDSSLVVVPLKEPHPVGVSQLVRLHGGADGKKANNLVKRWLVQDVQDVGKGVCHVSCHGAPVRRSGCWGGTGRRKKG